ncbi:MAG: DUF47 domain-containing protein [Francisellaceae bacterium]
MLRKLIKSLIPSRGEKFFLLFIKASENVHHTSNLLHAIITGKDDKKTQELVAEIRQQRQKALDINTEIEEELSRQFITPIDRGDIHYLSALMLKLTKRIIKINKKLQLYAIDHEVDDCLIRSAGTLQQITKALVVVMMALKNRDEKTLRAESKQAHELDENIIEDLGHALEEIRQKQYDMLTVVKLKEVYKAIESAVDTSATVCDLAVRIFVKDI